MAGTDQQAKGSQAQALPGANQAQPPADKQTPPGTQGGETKGEEQKGVKLYTQEEADSYAEQHANKKHGTLRKQLDGTQKWVNLLAYEHQQKQARVDELESLHKQIEDEGEKKNPDIAEINRMKREVKAKDAELKKREEALRFSEAGHSETLKKIKDYESKERVKTIADEFGISADDLAGLGDVSEETMRSVAERLGKTKKASEPKTTVDSGVGAGGTTQKFRSNSERLDEAKKKTK